MGNLLKIRSIIKFLKAVLLMFTALFMLVGITVFIVGSWIMFDVIELNLLPADLNDTVSYVIVGMSLLLAIVTLFAFSSIIKEKPGQLYTYGGVLASLCVMEIGFSASIACLKDAFNKSLYDGLTKNIATGKPPMDYLIFLQAKLGCCGIDNYTDWMKLSPYRVIPRFCCINETNCVTANYSDVYQKGCFDIITKYFEDNPNILIGLAICTTLFPLVAAVIACCLAGYKQKTKEVDLVVNAVIG